MLGSGKWQPPRAGQRAAADHPEIGVVPERHEHPAEAGADEPFRLVRRHDRDGRRRHEEGIDADPLTGCAVGAYQVGVGPEPAAGAVHPRQDGRRHLDGRREQVGLLDGEVHIGAPGRPCRRGARRTHGGVTIRSSEPVRGATAPASAGVRPRAWARRGATRFPAGGRLTRSRGAVSHHPARRTPCPPAGARAWRPRCGVGGASTRPRGREHPEGSRGWSRSLSRTRPRPASRRAASSAVWWAAKPVAAPVAATTPTVVSPVNHDARSRNRSLVRGV